MRREYVRGRRDGETRRDGFYSIALVALVVGLLMALSCWDDTRAAQAQAAPPAVVYIHPSRPPGLDLWPAAPFRVNCTPAGVANANAAGGEVEGVIRSVGDRWEVLTQGDFRVWVAYVPPRHHPSPSDMYYRYSGCYAGGHGHGLDFKTYPDVEFEVVHGRPLVLNSIEHVDTLYYPPTSPPLGVRWLISEHARLTGAPVPEPTPIPTPPRCVSPCRLISGACNCPPPAPSPSPAPTAAPPQPTPTPCPSCPPPVVCPQCPRFEPVDEPAEVRATIEAGLKALGRRWREKVARAKAWRAAHPGPHYVPGVESTSRISQTIESCEDAAVTALDLRECRERSGP